MKSSTMDFEIVQMTSFWEETKQEVLSYVISGVGIDRRPFGTYLRFIQQQEEKMSAYVSLPLEAWEERAREVCHAIDQKVKGSAEEFFFFFIESPDLDLLGSLLEQGSDMLLFALFSYIAKYPGSLARDCGPFRRLLSLISRWQLREFTFVRPQKASCQAFVTRTAMQAIGTIMKILYERSELSGQLLELLQGLPLNFLKVYLLKTFIETVEVVDSQMGYMRFRTMVYAFQDNVIPMICQTLMPFFYAFEEGLKINELSNLHSRLDVNEKTPSMSQSQVGLTRQQDMQSEYVLMLLKKIVEFNYNITYTEYESEQVIDTCLITFPQRVLQKIINHQFLGSLFYVIEKVCESRYGEHKNEYLSIVLECLAKIMQARLGYVSEQHKERFVMAAVKGLTHLLQICQQLQSQILLEGILVCNKKLFMSVQLGYIQKVIEKNEELAKAELYKVYLRDLSWMLLHIFKKSYVHTENSLLSEALEVSNKIVGHLGYRDQQSMDDSAQFYLSLAKDIVNNYVHNLCHPRCIFPTSQVLWLGDNKQAVSILFEHFKKLSSYVYFQLFSVLDYCLEKYANEHREELAMFANLLFLMSELVDRHFLQRNINLNKAKDTEIALLAMTIKKASMLVQEYIANRSIFRNHKDVLYLDIAILIFTQALLMEFLSNFEATAAIKIKQKLYLMMIFGQQYNDQLDQEENNSEQTIGVYLNVIFQFLESDVQGSDAEAKMLYALEVIEKVIFKLKWNMRRESFLKCQIFRQMLSFFEDYFTRCQKTPLIISKVGKITVSLNFDDILDEYKFRINKFIGKLPKNDVKSVFYYLMGIFQGIEPGHICRYFCFQLKKEINLPSFFHQIFKMVIESNTDKDYRDICRFCKLIALNKGLKHSNNSSLVYELFNLILPHLIWFIQTINECPNLNVDIIGDAILELIDLFCGIVNGTHVNIFVLDENQQNLQKNHSQQNSLGFTFVSQFFKLMILVNPQLKLYPKLQQACLTLFVSTNKEILEYIYDHEDSKLSDIYNFLMLRQIDMAVEYIIFQLNGNRLVEEKLLKVVDSLRIFYQYINRKSHIVHKRNTISNLKKFCELSESYGETNECKIEKLAFHAVSLIMTNHKNNTAYIRSISKLIYELNKRYRRYLLHTFEKLLVNVQKLREVQAILENYSEDIEENFIEHFKIWVKECNDYK